MNLSFGTSASDPDGTTPTLTSTTLPTGATYTDNLNGTGSFSWTPDFTQSGTHNVTFYASDGVATDSEQVVITVNNVNQFPVLAAIGAQSTTESVPLSVPVTASDGDGTIAVLTSSALPTGAVFTDNGDGSGALDWTPTFFQSGSYDVTFFATDDSLAVDSEVVTITVVDAGNQAPVLSAIGAQSTTENVLLSFSVSSIDIESIPTLTTSSLPTGASFTDNGNGTGSFGWTPDFLQSGLYSITFYATDDSLALDSEVVAVTVNDGGNQLPVLAAIGPQATTENVPMSFGVSASDIESTPAFSSSTLPSGASFVDNGDGTGSFDWTPTFLQSGSYDVTFYATDDSLAVDSEIVTMTVNEAGNQVPVLASIGAQSTSENLLLSFAVSATDIESIPALSATSLPSGASFVDNGDGTGSFDWTPTFLQSGSYDVTFFATDDSSETDFEIVTITVDEAGNQLPQFAVIGAQSTTENIPLSFNISATDPEGAIPALSAGTLPSGASFVDNGDGSGTFDWTPTFIQSGVYDVTFYATDDSLAVDSEIVSVTAIEAGNQNPTMAAVSAQSTTEGVALGFSVSATDPDATIPALSTEPLPNAASFVDNGDGTGQFSWTPLFNQSGTYNITIYATDDTLGIDSEIVNITVIESGNHVPILAAIGNQSVNEGVNLNFLVSAVDPDSTIPIMTTTALPTGASFIDNGNGTHSFDWTPGFTQAGSYAITFYASDGGASDSESIFINVFEVGNQPPTLAAIGNQTTTEGLLLNFAVSSSDPDSTNPALTTTTLPSGASFTDNGDGTGSFDWTPGFDQAGVYNLTFYASDGVGADSEAVAITVNEAGNQPPVLAAIGPQGTPEGSSLSFGTSASDADGTTPTLTSSTLPSGAFYTDNLDGTGSFSWTPDFTQDGIYNVTFYASDGIATDSEAVVITVADQGNQTPVLAAIGSKSTTEGIELAFSISATDADATVPTLSSSALPTGAGFIDNGDGTGDFSWIPDFVQSGSYDITFYASDGVAIDSEIVAVTVNEAGNQTPVLATVGPQGTSEGANLNLLVSSTDPDGTTPALSTSVLPIGASFLDNGDGTGNFDWTPGFTQSGSYFVIFYATDASLAADSEIVSITVNESGNQAPVLALIGSQSVTEGNSLGFGVTATDPDATTPTLTTSALPSGASFTDNGNGSGSFDWTPGFTESGSYNVTFYANDGAATDSEAVLITVVEAGNQTPLLASIGARSTTEGVLLSFDLSATDPDATIPTLIANSLPAGASFVDNGDGTGSFDWTPSFVQTGIYGVTFVASDGIEADSELVTITVSEAGNQNPALALIGSQSTTENVALAFVVTASDPEGATPTLTTSALPSGASYFDNGDGTANFDWTPGYTQSGTYNVTFYANDGLATDSEVVTISVLEAGNQIPVLASIGSQTTAENSLLSFGVTATDADGTVPSLSTSPLPTGALFVDNGDGSGNFDWTPSFVQSGSYNATFYAYDGIDLDSEIVTITVTESGNQAPVLASIGAQAITEGNLLSFAVSASDLDEAIPTMTTSSLPTGALFTDNANGTGSFDWTPDFTQSGTYNITFYASDGIATDSEVVAISVAEAGNRSPVLVTIGPKSTNENIPLAFGVSASDADGTTPLLSTSALPTGASFVDNSNGTGDFSWTPNFTQSGSYNVTFYAADGLAIDSEVVSITVNEEGNQSPVLAAIGAQSTTEGLNLNFAMSATDPDLTTPTFSSTTLPEGATLTDNLDGTAILDWTPAFVQAGTYDISFYATDGSATDSESVTITVNEAGNQNPVLSAIGARSVLEGSNLSFAISSVDPDSTIPTLATSTLPGGAAFVDNGDGSGSFDWTPNFTQSGTYDVTFYANDGLATDSEIVTITVNEAGNQIPVLASIGPKNTTEGTLLSFPVTATDADGVDPSLNTTSLPSGASFVDNGDGTGQFNWTPNFTQSGTYNVAFIATDGAVSDSEVVSITINEAGNQPPVLAAIGPKNSIEGALLAFSVTATDADGFDPAMLTSPLPTGASFVDNGDGSGDFNWTPSFVQGGVYNITFYASDGASQDSETVVITINEAGNQPPVLAAIGAQTTSEGASLAVGATATDVDGTIPSLSTSVLPTGASFVDNGDGSGNFDWTPNFTQSGTYNVTFYADDGLATDSEIVTISVSEGGNQAPILSSIGAQTTTEGNLLSLNLTVVDPDATIPNMTASSLPAGASFVNNGDGTADFDWTPDFTQAGTYNVTFFASDGILSDSEVVAITVIEAGNQYPIMAAIGAQSGSEGANLSFGVTAVDPDATTPVLTTTTLPTGAFFTDNGDGSGSFDWTPDFTQSGIYNVTFYASDGVLVDSEQVVITISDPGNQEPALAAIGDRNITEGNILIFGVSASDADGTIPTLTTTAVPSGATFTDNGDGTGSFDWTPTFVQAGAYPMTFYASDGIATDSEQVTITVFEAGNQTPVLAAIGSKNTAEGTLLSFSVSATDADGTIPAVIATSLPTGAAFVDNGDGTGTFNWTPTFVQSGAYNVVFSAWDGIAQDSEIVSISVTEAGNQAPQLAAIGAQSGTEGALLSVVVSATDPDASVPALSTSTLPTGASFVNNGDGTGSFDWTPTFVQAGSYDVTFYASDGVLLDSELVTITINDAGNQPPVLAAIGAQSITEGLNLAFAVSASDPDATIPTLTTSALPTGAAFVDNGDGSGNFDWTPTFTQSGGYNIIFYTSDGLATDSEVVTITVIEAGNQSPALAAIGPKATTENSTLTFAVTATDPDASIPGLTTSALPTGASFVDNGDGTGNFDWTPTFIQSGIYNVTFYATDGLATDSEQVTIVVTESGNQAPILAAIGAQSITEGLLLSFGISATDPDLTTPALTTSVLPTGAIFTNNGDGTGSIDWTPTYVQSGVYSLTVYASDGVLVDSEVVAITVNDAGNQTPILVSIGAQSVNENVNLNFGVSATDPDETIPTLTTSALPTGAAFIDNGDGTGVFDWTPDFLQSGTHSVTFYATDDTLAADSEVVTITVTEGGNQPPALAAIGAQSTTENSLLTFGVTATDFESTPALTTSALPIGAAFVDNGDGTGAFDWTPDFLQSGSYDVTFYAADDSLAVDSEIVTITVIDGGNQLPILTAIGAQSTTENLLLTFGVTASDIESTPSLTTSALPTGAAFVDNGDGTGAFDWTPDFLQSGSYDVTFYATDDSLAVDSEVVTITVIDGGNQLPILTAIGAQSTTENILLPFGVTAADIESIPTLTTSALPTGAAFVDNGDGTGAFDWTPTFIQAGTYNVTFYATDDSLAVDSEIITITVIEAGNQPPVLAAIGSQSVPENVNLNFSAFAVDPDSTIPTMLTSALPSGAIFTDNGDGSGTFDWTPGFAQEGLYSVTFYADDGLLIDSEIVSISVITTNQIPIADAGPDQVDLPAGQPVQLDGSGSFDPDLSGLTYDWQQISGAIVTLSDNTASQPTFTPTVIDVYLFELTVFDGVDFSAPDTVSITVISGAPPQAVADLSIQIVGDAVQLSWSAVTLDTDALPAIIDRYVIYRGTSAYFVPTPADSIGATDDLTLTFTDTDLGGANVVGDTATQYFYLIQTVNFLENRSANSNRVGEFDYGLTVTSTTNYNLVGVPFTNSSITDAVSLIAAIGSGNVFTANNYVVASQSFQSRFAAGFGTNFAVTAGGIYQINAAQNAIFSVAGNVPAAGTISYPIATTATTDFNFVMIPFELESSFTLAQDVINSVPGLFNTLNEFRASSQSYVSRFAIGFGTNFAVRAGKPYQANAATAGTFPAP
ncbi:MAG: Ig-like domain-containing protein [bacterium]|nr:Ig-like domain-containing protein [bacterium]